MGQLSEGRPTVSAPDYSTAASKNWNEALSLDTAGNLRVTAVSGTPSASRTLTDSTATIGTGSSTALAANASRKGFYITNTSNANYVSFNVTDAAVLYSGVTLGPGATWQMTSDDFNTGAITAIASSAGTVLSIMEIT